MSRKRHPLTTITRLSTRFIRRFLVKTKKQLIWLLRTVFGTQKQQNAANAGFVLPTVVMVSVVVVLLTTAIMFRSFDRAKNASNVRVNQAVLSAVTPAIDRGRAKINQLFADKTLPRATPTDDALYNVIVSNIDKYTFGDETTLQISFDVDGNSKIDAPTPTTKLSDNETSRTAWKFPVDTDNNGKFDSYNIYGIYFRTPSVETGGKYSRKRNPLEGRTPPMAEVSLDDNCGANTSATLVGSTGWVKQNNELKKSLFVYTATIPITTNSTYGSDTNYEIYKGNKGFAAVEYQQDRVQIPPNNNAVVYEDDIALTPGADFNLNGAVFTNSNFLTSGMNGGTIKFYQVSSTSSCYYEAKNAKIIVGGNTAVGGFGSTGDSSSKVPTVDLYKGKNITIGNTPWVKSATSSPAKTAYNNLAYVNRINILINDQIAKAETTDPSEVTTGLAAKEKALGQTLTGADRTKYRRQQIEYYFRKRTRRVPYTEVAFNATDTSPSPLVQGGLDSLRPNDTWIYPVSPTDGKIATSFTKVGLNISGASLEPKATEPIALKNASGVEGQVGDRVIVGNNLPQIWWDKTKSAFVSSGVADTQDISGVKWDAGDTTKTRTRKSLVQTLADVGDTSRDGEWELAAAKVPADPTEAVGGLRVVTGAGIYLRDTETPAAFTTTNNPIKIIWPDSNPVPQSLGPTNKTITPYSVYNPSITYKWREIADNPSTTTIDESRTPFLQMRATAVYHYKGTGYNQQTPQPIACVSSFYVPTNSTTLRNRSDLPAAANTLANTNNTPTPNAANTPAILKDANGLSNNGIVYPAPTRTETNYSQLLAYQATLTYPNGRLIDDGLLAKALGKTAASRTISERSAIDAQICALQILDGSLSPSDSVIPHGAIREVAFLDSREVKQNSGSGTPLTDDKVLVPSTTYNLPVQDRQPLEIRATVLDLNLLRTKEISGASPKEYLLPNSGIIYATRDDALPDMSADIPTSSPFPLPLPVSPATSQVTEANKLVNPVDYELDPTRRPNGIMLVSGSKIWRTQAYREEEKGLILATNLPVYIKGDFNLHTQEEYTTALASDYGNFYTRTSSNLNPNFACRSGDPRFSCPTGDEWRPATVLADAVTLLTSNFREGFREEGEYDWNNTLDDLTLPPGYSLSKFNSYAPLGTWDDTTSGNVSFPRDFDTTTTGYQGSSYVNNFVTPLIRWLPKRTGNQTPWNIPGFAYAYEVCTSSVATDCDCSSTDTAAQCAVKNRRWALTNVALSGYNGTNGQNIWLDGDINSSIVAIKTGFAGPNGGSNGWEALPFRRLALKRERNPASPNYTLPVTPLTYYGDPGGNGSRKLKEYPVNGTSTPAIVTVSTTIESIPWLREVSGRLEPVLQIRYPFATETNLNPNPKNLTGGIDNKNWLQSAFLDSTPAANRVATFNLIVAAGDSPARFSTNNTEDNGGLHNFVRFMQNWQQSGGTATAKISGAFMQVKKSAYATGPFATALSTSDNNLLYAILINSGQGTGYLPPNRQWGYDVALLSQSPDLFASKLVFTPPDLPDEYFREVGRDDRWVQQLLCAKEVPLPTTADPTPSPTNYAIDTEQRPDTCKS
ncbi:hypothetical protein FJR11_10170 [Anabaena sp. UHCC 0187]|uniref:hormogonium polysaccharide biosynthesis protein HpsA n=1 Tax=Anabaena sp. UHCC 0187 TaxID=2590018 RepID=UPI0014452375|nr:hormogonium polysaccharide biosynthesis protein HpsA [Anabaena sp. UHCC 0187]MTJ12949.1 hypothetical protein [Anabaena sp. UHCC 0187]